MSRANADIARTARRIAIGAFLVYAATGGGRITGSDEVTMFELSRALLHGAIAVPAGATLDGPDGRHYTKNSAGQAVLALPLTAAAEAAGGASWRCGSACRSSTHWWPRCCWPRSTLPRARSRSAPAPRSPPR
jgi:hypothetical protein